jgi:hypothetical protein
MSRFAIALLLFGCGCGDGGQMILDEAFTSLSSWVTVAGTPQLDSSQGHPAPSVDLGNDDAAVTLRSSATFPVAQTTTVSADLQIDASAAQSQKGAGLWLRVVDAGSHAWYTFAYFQQLGAPRAAVTGGPGSGQLGGGFAPNFNTPITPDGGWHSIRLVVKSSGTSAYWDGILQSTSASPFSSDAILHVELIGLPSESGVPIRVDNVKVTSP